MNTYSRMDKNSRTCCEWTVSRNSLFSILIFSISSRSLSISLLALLDSSIVSVNYLMQSLMSVQLVYTTLPWTNCCNEAISSCARRSWCWISASRLYSATKNWLFISFKSSFSFSLSLASFLHSPATYVSQYYCKLLDIFTYFLSGWINLSF